MMMLMLLLSFLLAFAFLLLPPERNDGRDDAPADLFRRSRHGRARLGNGTPRAVPGQHRGDPRASVDKRTEKSDGGRSRGASRECADDDGDDGREQQRRREGRDDGVGQGRH